jgi:hypothetical protein
MELWTQIFLVNMAACPVFNMQACSHKPALPAELDAFIGITQVGVSQFVLCRDSVHNPVLLLNIPKSKVAFHACEANAELSTLEVTCQPTVSSPTGFSSAATGSRRTLFLVHLQQTHSGNTQPTAVGMAQSLSPQAAV